MQFTTVGIDLAKSVFQISVADSTSRPSATATEPFQFERFIVHTPPARLVMEGCASAHHWGRLAQSHGHEVTLLHAHYVRTYLQRNKTDAVDALPPGSGLRPANTVLASRVGHNKATVALANKMARILWAVWTKGAHFDGNHAARYH